MSITLVESNRSSLTVDLSEWEQVASWARAGDGLGLQSLPSVLEGCSALNRAEWCQERDQQQFTFAHSDDLLGTLTLFG